MIYPVELGCSHGGEGWDDGREGKSRVGDVSPARQRVRFATTGPATLRQLDA